MGWAVYNMQSSWPYGQHKGNSQPYLYLFLAFISVFYCVFLWIAILQSHFIVSCLLLLRTIRYCQHHKNPLVCRSEQTYAVTLPKLLLQTALVFVWNCNWNAFHVFISELPSFMAGCLHFTRETKWAFYGLD